MKMTPGFFKVFVYLQVPYSVPLAYIFFQVDPERNDQVYDYRRGHGNKREVYKVQADTGRSNAPSFAKIAAYTKCTLFYKIL